MTIRLQAFENTCGSCGAKWRDLRYTGSDNSVVVFRTVAGELAVIYPDADIVWAAFNELVDQTIAREGLRPSPAGRARLFLAGFEVTLDPAPSGLTYQASATYRCPTCGSAKLDYWPVEPPEFAQMEPQIATHHRWSELAEAEQERAIYGVIRLQQANRDVP
jgi:hypothetical protein